MNSFKDLAYQILKEAGKSLHSREITKIALERGWLKTLCSSKREDLKPKEDSELHTPCPSC